MCSSSRRKIGVEIWDRQILALGYEKALHPKVKQAIKRSASQERLHCRDGDKDVP